MKNGMRDLQNYLFECIERLQDDSLSDEELDRELKRADGVSKIATNIINTQQTALHAAKFLTEYGHESSRNSPLMALIGDVKDE